jgi:PAS domain S-box-containing protein
MGTFSSPDVPSCPGSLSPEEQAGLYRENKRLRRRIQELERDLSRLRLLVDSFPDLVFLEHRDGTFLDFVTGDTSELAVQPDSFLGESAPEELGPELNRIRRESIVRALNTGTVQTFSYAISIDGLWRDYEARVVPCDEDEVYVVCRDVTEHKRLIQRLQESERKYRLITERISDVVWVMDMDLRFSFVSRSVSSVLGFSPEEVLGRSVADVVSPDALVRIRDLIRRRLEKVGDDPSAAVLPLTVEMELTHCQGHAVPVESISSMLLDDQGRPECMVGVARDISERRRAQAEVDAAAEVLRNSENRYRNLFEESPLSLWEEDLSELKKYFDALRESGVQDFRSHFAQHPESLARCQELIRVIDVNKATLQLFKSPSKELLLGNLEKIIPQEGLEAFYEEMVELAEGNWSYQGEIMQRTLTGEKKLCLIHISIVPGHEQDLGRVVVSLQDITQRRNDERRAVIKYRIAQSVVRAEDMQGLFAEVHAVVADYVPAENFIAGLQDEEKDTLHPVYFKDQKDHYLPIRNVSDPETPGLSCSVIRSGLPLLMTGREIRRGLRDGTRKSFGILPECWLGVPMRIKNRVIGILVVQDYEDPDRYSKADMDLLVFAAEQVALGVERKRYEEALRRAKAAAEAASRAKSEFLANMSHEIRTPLTGILGMAELIRTLGVSEEQERYLDLLGQSGNGLLRLLNDILDFSKVEAGKMELVEDDFVLGDLLDSVMSLFTQQAGEKGLELAVRVEENVPAMLRGDHSRLRQVLINLVGNAVKFTDSGLVEVRVGRDRAEETSSKPDRVPLVFAVRDTGPGIPVGKQERIFESFTQADGSLARKFGGVGLGLAISNRLASLMGGRIALESVPGAGATFSFFVRLIPVGERCAYVGPEKSLQPATQGGKILLAEDNTLNQLFMAKLLSRKGFEVVTVRNGQEALHALDEDCFDCVLMDVQMPVLDGEEATRRIRAADKPWRDIPIIALTAHAMKGDRARFLEAGMDDYLSKPLSMDALEEALARVTGRPGETQ